MTPVLSPEAWTAAANAAAIALPRLRERAIRHRHKKHKTKGSCDCSMCLTYFADNLERRAAQFRERAA